MSFERKSLRILVPLDPTEGSRYTELVRDYEESDADLDMIYKKIVQDQDWVNPIADGRISWDFESSCTSESDKELEHSQNRLHEVSTLRYNMMTKSIFVCRRR